MSQWAHYTDVLTVGEGFVHSNCMSNRLPPAWQIMALLTNADVMHPHPFL
jgi:hypothetical protein